MHKAMHVIAHAPTHRSFSRRFCCIGIFQQKDMETLISFPPSVHVKCGNDSELDVDTDTTI